jgi:hypothetical protein
VTTKGHFQINWPLTWLRIRELYFFRIPKLFKIDVCILSDVFRNSKWYWYFRTWRLQMKMYCCCIYFTMRRKYSDDAIFQTKFKSLFLKRNLIFVCKIALTVRKHCSSDEEELFQIQCWRQRICKIFVITETVYATISIRGFPFLKPIEFKYPIQLL